MENKEFNKLFYEIEREIPNDTKARLYKLREGYQESEKQAVEEARTFYTKAAAFGLIPIVAYMLFRHGITGAIGDSITAFLGGLLIALLPFSIYFSAYVVFFKNAGKFKKLVYTVIAAAVAVFLAYKFGM